MLCLLMNNWTLYYKLFGGETEQSADARMEEEESIKALLFDEEMEALGQTCLDHGESSLQIVVWRRTTTGSIS